MPKLRHVLGTAVAVLFGAAVLAGCDPQPPVKSADLTTSTSVAPTTTTTVLVTTPAPTTTTTTQAPPPPPPVETTLAPVPQHTTVAAPAPGPQACGPDTYRNSDGNCIPRPKAAPAPPPGATARCKDGTYSFSAHRSGTCSGHGGVAEWL